MPERIFKTQSLSELIALERAPQEPEPTRHLPALHAVYLRCLDCTLPECDEDGPLCPIKLAAKTDPKLKSKLAYQRWAEKNGERLAEQKRADYERRRQGGAEKVSPAPASRRGDGRRRSAAAVESAGRRRARVVVGDRGVSPPRPSRGKGIS